MHTNEKELTLPAGMRAAWGQYESSVAEWLGRVERTALLRRLWDKDTTLWKKDAASHREIASRLGWLAAPRAMRDMLADLSAFRKEIRAQGYRNAVLLGMGGSSLASEVIANVFGNDASFPALRILDTTDPAAVREAEQEIELDKTLFIVSSKSGGTIELMSLFKYFYAKLESSKKDAAGMHFVAITDPGTSLAKLAREHKFRKVFLAPEDVGGRFSALTVFGLVPATVTGLEAGELLDSAEKMMERCLPAIPASDNPAAVLGVAMAVLAESGRDKLTVITNETWGPFGDWVEQLVAESSGKEGTGIVPIIGEPLGEASEYGNDRFFVVLLPEAGAAASIAAKLEAIEKAGHPVLRIAVNDASYLGAEFFRWELATALACSLLKVNAFDQPDVQAAKDRTKAILKDFEGGKAIEPRESDLDAKGLWQNVEDEDYVAFLAFLPGRESFRKRIEESRLKIRAKSKHAVTTGIGPRYLHSTGQLHKGGANNGVFCMITAPHTDVLAVPGEKYTFADLQLAQAMGDFEALEKKGRWVVHLRLKELSDAALDEALKRFEEPLG